MRCEAGTWVTVDYQGNNYLHEVEWSNFIDTKLVGSAIHVPTQTVFPFWLQPGDMIYYLPEDNNSVATCNFFANNLDAGKIEVKTVEGITFTDVVSLGRKARFAQNFNTLYVK